MGFKVRGQYQEKRRNMNLYKEFGTSTKKELEGIKITPIEGIHFYCRRSGGANKAYQEASTKRLRPYLQKFNSGKNIPLDIIQDINIENFCDWVLLGWENVTFRDGTPMEFTKDNAKKLLKELPELYSALESESSDVNSFKENDDIPGK